MPDWLEKVVTGGPALIFAAMWWLERQERRQERDEHKTVSRDMISAMLKVENTLEAFGKIFSNGKAA